VVDGNPNSETVRNTAFIRAKNSAVVVVDVAAGGRLVTPTSLTMLAKEGAALEFGELAGSAGCWVISVSE
jgi:hypothetical protein